MGRGRPAGRCTVALELYLETQSPLGRIPCEITLFRQASDVLFCNACAKPCQYLCEHPLALRKPAELLVQDPALALWNMPLQVTHYAVQVMGTVARGTWLYFLMCLDVCSRDLTNKTLLAYVKCMSYTNQARAEFCYPFPHPGVTTDLVVFALGTETLDVLLSRRTRPPYRGYWTLPGGPLGIDEDLDQAASRRLIDETGVDGLYLEQLYTFGACNRDPRERSIAVTYFALVPRHLRPHVACTRADTGWFPANTLPELAFDHGHIIDTARQRLSAKIRYTTIACQLLGPQFTLSELQQVYEILREERLDKRNFRKWVQSLDFVEETGEMRRTGLHRPARLYRATQGGQVRVFK